MKGGYTKYLKYLLILVLIFFAIFPPYNAKEMHVAFYEESQYILSGGRDEFQYRYTSFYVFDKIFDVVHNIVPEEFKSVYRSTMTSLVIINLLTIPIGLFFMLKLFEEKNRAYVLVFSLLLIAVLNKSLWYIQPYDAFLFPFVMASLYFMRKGQYKLIPMLTFIASLFHQIAFLIPLYYFFNQKIENKKSLNKFILRLIILVLAWGIPYILFKFVFFPFVSETHLYVFQRPFIPLLYFNNGIPMLLSYHIFDIIMILIPFIAFFILSLKHTLEKFQTHYRWAVVLYFLIVTVASVPTELRLFLQVLPFLIPNFSSLKISLSKK